MLHLCGAQKEEDSGAGLRLYIIMDLSTAYRYNQNMMEYYTCKSECLVICVEVGGGGEES